MKLTIQVQKAHSSKENEPKEVHTKILIEVPKVEGKERISKVVMKKSSYVKGSACKTLSSIIKFWGFFKN